VVEHVPLKTAAWTWYYCQLHKRLLLLLPPRGFGPVDVKNSPPIRQWKRSLLRRRQLTT